MPHTSRSPKLFRSAFTLLEVMLVMAILVVLGSIAVPLLDGVMERQKLRGSAEELRLAWEGARLKAMRTGQAQVFQCAVDSGSYTIQPLILHDDVNNVGMGATLMSGGVAVQTANTNFGVTVSAADPQQFTPTKLDEAISFVSCRVASDSRAFSMAQTGGSAGVSMTNIGQTVIFYPDGSTSTAEALIRNKSGDISGVQIRGLTGHSRVLGITSNSEASRK